MYQQPYQGQYQYAPQMPSGAKGKSKIGIVAAVIAVVVLIIFGISRYTGGANPLSALGWKGFKDFESFSKAADMDEFLGEKLTEEGFAGIILLGALFSDEIKLDIVSGDTLTERYDVPITMRQNYNYLVKGDVSTVYLAMFMSDRWGVAYWSGE